MTLNHYETEIIRCLARSSIPMTINQISKKSQISHYTTTKYIKKLETEGYLEKKKYDTCSRTYWLISNESIIDIEPQNKQSDREYCERDYKNRHYWISKGVSNHKEYFWCSQCMKWKTEPITNYVQGGLR